jgi:hypothetical protein
LSERRESMKSLNIKLNILLVFFAIQITLTLVNTISQLSDSKDKAQEVAQMLTMQQATSEASIKEVTIKHRIPPNEDNLLTPLEYKKNKGQDQFNAINQLPQHDVTRSKTTLSSKEIAERVKENNPLGWDCNLYQCGKSNSKIFPPSIKIINSLLSTLNFTLSNINGKSTTDLAVVFDINCSNCRSYFNETLMPLSEKGYKIKLIPASYKDIEEITETDFIKQSQFLCAEDKMKMIQDIYKGLAPTTYADSCSKEMVLSVINKTKKALKPYGLDRMTPISFTPKAILNGKHNIALLTKYF